MTDSELGRPLAADRLTALAGTHSGAQKYSKDGAALWIVIASVIAIDAVWLFASGIRISVGSITSAALTILVALDLFYSIVRPRPWLATFAMTFAQLMALTFSIIVLTYVMAAVAFPLVDDTLAAVDAALGFDWLTFFNWTRQHPSIGYSLDIFYEAATPQVGTLVVVLSITGQLERVREFVWLYGASLLLITTLSFFMPAEGAWSHYGVAHLTSAYYLPDFADIRSGSMKVVNLSTATGIVQFPSFHAALGLVLIVSAWRTILFPLFLPLNIVMIASALTAGGHYLTDIIAGLAIVPASIFILRKLRPANS